MGSTQYLYVGNYIKADFSKIDFYDILENENLSDEIFDILKDEFNIAGEELVDLKGFSYILSAENVNDGKYIELEKMDGEESLPERDWNNNWKFYVMF